MKSDKIIKRRYVRIPSAPKSDMPGSLMSTSEIGPSDCITTKNAVNVKYQWDISNFNTNFDNLESPIFSNGKNIEWRMKIEKKNFDIKPTSVVLPHPPQDPPQVPPRPSVFGPAEEIIYNVKLLVVSSNSSNIQFHCKFQLLSRIPKNTITKCKHFLYNLGMCLDCFEIKRHYVLNVFNGFLQDDSITITCEINAVMEMSFPYMVPKCTLLDDFEVFFENQEFSDFTFNVSGKEFHVHKAILAARSSVFKAMVKQSLEESNNRIELSEVKEEVFRELLRFVYTGKAYNLNKIAIDLFPVADKYGLENLKVLCVQELCMKISVKNAVEVLILANLHSLDNLKTIAIGFIGSNAVDVSKTEGWNDMIRSHPELFTEVLINVSIQLLQVEI